MTDITKLPDKWRELARAELPIDPDCNIHAQGYDSAIKYAADELEAALPNWTRINDEPATKPPQGRVMTATWIDGWIATTIAAEELEIGDDWRPLCDLDYPPELSE